MKKGKILAVFILGVMAVLVLAACGKDTKVPEELFGTWVSETDLKEAVEGKGGIEVGDNTELLAKDYVIFNRDYTYEIRIVLEDDFIDLLTESYTESMYAALMSESNNDREAAEALMMEKYGMTVTEWAAQEAEKKRVTESAGTFYVVGNRIVYNAVYSRGNSSYNIYSLEDGVLTLTTEEEYEVVEYIGNTAVYTKVKDAE